MKTPLITKSTLSNPPRWYVVTRYTERQRIDAETGEPRHFIVASKKYDVTDQMEAILGRESGERKERV